MTWAVAWRPLAERDLTDCAAYIAEDNVDAALRFVDAVEETVAALAESPMLGTTTHFAHAESALQLTPRFHSGAIPRVGNGHFGPD